MRSVKFLIAAGAATLMSSAAFAADMAIAPPPAYAPPPVVEDFGGWYLRGDIGFSNQSVERLNNLLDAGNTSSVQSDSAPGIFGLGVVTFNNWFRVDVTGEYRATGASARTPSPIPPVSGRTSTTPPSEWVVLANGYVDFTCGMTPFIGVCRRCAGLDRQLHR
jgi:opacity protein-like surface antigen